MVKRLKMSFDAIRRRRERHIRHKQLHIRDEALFMSRLYELVHEGYSLHDALFLVVPHHVKDADAMTEQLHEQFQAGVSAYELFRSLRLRYVNLLPLITSAVTSDIERALHQMYEATTQRLELQQNFRKVLIYPLILISFFLAMLVSYRTIFLPKMKMMYTSDAIETTFVEQAVQTTLTYAPDVLLCSTIIVVGVGLHFYNRGIRHVLPVTSLYFRMRPFRAVIRLYATHHFAMEFGRLLETDIHASEALMILQQQRYNEYVAVIAQMTYEALAAGEALDVALEQNDYVLEDIALFVRHGSMRGFVGRELLLFGRVVNESIVRRMEWFIAAFQPLVFLIIGVAIVTTYLSILLPMYRLIGNF